ncbi:Aggrecan core protein [Labeo rohita]|uniref:Aggrecan core protein n=1 Tax=Labeo rohita TaxID=84645 RepID=A0ABQ8MJS2_LABRO|nr:C-type lectin 1 [Labeo rohita]KAI2663115.1 Aggrecan core protein [Labeo rohita]
MCVTFSQLHDYFFVPEKVNWTTAQTYCRQHYTDLATIDNQQDNDNVLNTAGYSNSWIGLYRTSGDTPLIWSDGSNLTYSDWGAGQPSNNNNAQWCVSIYSQRWNDKECYYIFPFVCYLERKKMTVRVELKSSQNLNDPAVMNEILAKMEQILKEKGLEEHAKLLWRNQSKGNVLQKKQQKSDANQTCLTNK